MSTDHAKLEKPKMDVYSGVRWSAFSKYGAQGMQFVISMVMARLLAPEYFGLLGMATVITGFVQIFRNLGFNSAIIQRKEVSAALLSTLFWVNLGMCLLVGLVVLGIAPVASWIYDDPRVTPIIAALSVNFVFAGFTMIPAALLTRRMEFKKLAIREIGGVLISGVTGVSLAYLGWGAWALVASTLASSAAQMVLINLAIPFRPHLVIDRRGLAECLRFGLNLTGFNIFNYFSRNADNLIIGVYLGPAALGLYSIAYKLMLLPRDALSRVIMRVMFPTLARIQDNDEKLAETYVRATGAIAFLTFPIMIGLAVLARPFVTIVLGERWISVVPVIQVLAPIGMVQSITATLGQVFLAKGNSETLLRIGILGGVVRVIAFLVGVQWGILGVAISYAATQFPLTLTYYYCAGSVVPPLTMRRCIQPLIPSLAAALACGVSAHATGFWIRSDSAQGLFVAVLSGAVTYAAISRWSDPTNWNYLGRLAGIPAFRST